ncbi:MAG: HU family DNA-binding protein [Treponema sp.]|nr:HU family DNA-binding protein [Treponema sp.]
MNRKEMVRELSDSLELDKTACAVLIDTVQDEIIAILARGGKFTHSHFGSFSTTIVAEHEGRNPRTGERLRIPKKRKVKFTPAKALKENINGQ